MHHAAKKIRRDHTTPQRGALLIPSLAILQWSPRGTGPLSASISVKMPLGSYAAEMLLNTLLHYLAVQLKS